MVSFHPAEVSLSKTLKLHLLWELLKCLEGKSKKKPLEM